MLTAFILTISAFFAVFLLIMVFSLVSTRRALMRAEPKKSSKPFSPDRAERERQGRAGNAFAAARPHERATRRSEDGLLLHAFVLPAAVPSKRTVLAFHGYRSTGFHDMGMFVRFYHERGMNLIIPDDRTHGKSEGNYIGLGFLDRRDALSWCRWALERFGQDTEILLHGMSMGAATVCGAAGEPDLPASVRAGVSDCGFSTMHDEMRWLLRRFPPFLLRLLMPLFSLSCKLLAGYFYRDCRPVHALKNATIPFLFVHGEADMLVPPSMARALFDACPAPKELFLVPDAGHVLAYIRDKEGYERRLDALIAQAFS